MRWERWAVVAATQRRACWSRRLAGLARPHRRARAAAELEAAFASEAGLAKRHDTVALLGGLYLLAREQDDAATRERLLPGLRAVLKEVP